MVDFIQLAEQAFDASSEQALNGKGSQGHFLQCYARQPAQPDTFTPSGFVSLEFAFETCPAIRPRLDPHSGSSCISVPGAGSAGECHHAWGTESYSPCRLPNPASCKRLPTHISNLEKGHLTADVCAHCHGTCTLRSVKPPTAASSAKVSGAQRASGNLWR